MTHEIQADAHMCDTSGFDYTVTMTGMYNHTTDELHYFTCKTVVKHGDTKFVFTNYEIPDIQGIAWGEYYRAPELARTLYNKYHPNSSDTLYQVLFDAFEKLIENARATAF